MHDLTNVVEMCQVGCILPRLPNALWHRVNENDALPLRPRDLRHGALLAECLSECCDTRPLCLGLKIAESQKRKRQAVRPVVLDILDRLSLRGCVRSYWRRFSFALSGLEQGDPVHPGRPPPCGELALGYVLTPF